MGEAFLESCLQKIHHMVVHDVHMGNAAKRQHIDVFNAWCFHVV